MITVEDLSKRFGTTLAVHDISFTIQKGEVVGFLGPNGAGKTTTMRILAGSLGATSGHAIIDDLDVFKHPRRVKRRIGYLPERPPLYGGMTVESFIRFSANIKGASEPNAATRQVLHRVGLQQMSHRLIGHLSKGYRQRVGLAQALVHDPDVLILDEPTSNLDPAQRVEIRDLIQELAEGDRTVILSTHVLSEVEDICERVIIIDRGRLLTTDRIDALARETRRIKLRVARREPELADRLASLSGVVEVHEEPDGRFTLLTEHDIRADIARFACQYDLLELTGQERLEDVYLRLISGSGPDDPETTGTQEPVSSEQQT